MPSDTRDALGSIVVVGDGQVGLSAAIALRSSLPLTDVLVVACGPDPSAIADRCVTSLPTTTAFHERFGLDEAGFVLRAGASHRLAVRFLDWQFQGSSCLHGYGASTSGVFGASGVLSVSQTLADANRFAHPADDSSSPLSDIDYAIRFHPTAYRRRLLALARHLGVRHSAAIATGAVADKDGGISHVMLDDGAHLNADLFVDCTGPQRLVINAAKPVKFIGWSAMLPCDRLLIAETLGKPTLVVTDEIRAFASGWCTGVKGRDGVHEFIAFNAAIGSDAEIGAGLDREFGKTIAFEPGRMDDAWVGNVIAFGDAAAMFEPLHFANLALAHQQILLFLEMLPGRQADVVERAEYNRRAGAMADRVRDFIGLHYCGFLPQGQFWQHAASLQHSSELKLTVSEYRKRGRLPFFEEEIFSRDAWHSAMACVGVSRGASALSRSTPEAIMTEQRRVQQERSFRAAEMASPYPEWLRDFVENSP